MALGRADMAADDPDAALTEFDIARTLVVDLLKKVDTNNVPETLARINYLTAGALAAVGDVEGALDASQKSLDRLSIIASPSSEDIDLRAFKAQIRIDRAELLIDEKRWSEAGQLLRSAKDFHDLLDKNQRQLISVRDGLVSWQDVNSQLVAE